MSTTLERPRTSWHGMKMSVEEFLALPEDGVHRELIKGTVREERDFLPADERGRTMTVRNRFHSRIVSRKSATSSLTGWRDNRSPEARWSVAKLGSD